MAVAAAIACVTSFGRGDGVRELDEPIDGIDNGDLLAIIYIFFNFPECVYACKNLFHLFQFPRLFRSHFSLLLYLN